MDARSHLPALLNWELITPENFADHLPAIEHALGLKADSLQLLFGENSLAAFSNDLDVRIEEINYQISKSIDAAAMTRDSRDDLTMRFREARHQQYLAMQTEIVAHLASIQQQAINEFTACTDSCKRKIMYNRDCHFGNYGIKLNIFKRNIAIALQHAAYTAHQYLHELHEQPESFNAIFKGIAAIQPDKKLLLDDTAADQFVALSLGELQQRLSAIDHAAAAHHNPMLSRYVRAQLENLNHHRATTLNNGAGLLALEDRDITLTPIAYEIETLAASATAAAQSSLSNLDQIETAKINAFENNPKQMQLMYQLRSSMQHALDDLTTLRNIHSRMEREAGSINNTKEDTRGALAKAENVVNDQPVDKRQETAQLLVTANLELPAAHRERVIKGLQDLLDNTHDRFMRATRLDFLLKHGSGLLDQLNLLSTELTNIYENAITANSPLKMPGERFDAIKARHSELQASLATINQTIDKIHAEREMIYSTFNQQREEFLNLLKDMLRNEWRPDLEQRLDATLLDIDDLIKKYSDHPAFPHTSLDDVIIDMLRDYRTQTLATQQTLAADFIPQEANAAKPSLFNTYPVISSILIGAATGLGAGLLGAFLTVITGGLALLPIALVIAGVCAAIGAGTGGIVGKLYSKHRQAVPADIATEADADISATKASRTSSARIISKTGGLHLSRSDKSAHELNEDDLDGSEDELEVVADYSRNGGLVADDSTEYVPTRLRRT